MTARARFSRERRIRRRVDFRRIQARGRRVFTPSFVLLFSARDATEADLPARLGITASRRVGNAVVRNRAKRIVREAFRDSGPMFGPGLDLVVIVRHPDAAQLSPREVLAEWQGVSKRLEKAAESARKDRREQAAPSTDPARS